MLCVCIKLHRYSIMNEHMEESLIISKYVGALGESSKLSEALESSGSERTAILFDQMDFLYVCVEPLRMICMI